jgi:hypothetical protein
MKKKCTVNLSFSKKRLMKTDLKHQHHVSCFPILKLWSRKTNSEPISHDDLAPEQWRITSNKQCIFLRQVNASGQCSAIGCDLWRIDNAKDPEVAVSILPVTTQCSTPILFSARKFRWWRKELSARMIFFLCQERPDTCGSTRCIGVQFSVSSTGRINRIVANWC